MEVECEFVDWINLVQDGGPITGSLLGLSTTLYLNLLSVCIRSLMLQSKCRRRIKPSGILRHGGGGLLQVNLEG